MTAHAAVSVHDDFTAGEPGITLRSANDETACGIDEKFGGCVEEVLRNHLANDICDEKFADLFGFNIVCVLGRNHDIGHAHGLAVLVENGDLALRVGAEPFHLAGFADGGELPAEAVGKHDRSGHELRSLVAGISKHEALVSRALFGSGFALGFLGVHALRDVCALGGKEVGNEDTVSVEDIVVVGVADTTNGFANDRADIQNRVKGSAFDFWDGDLTTYDDGIAFHEGLAGNTAGFVDREAGVEDGVGNGVADFIWMAFANGFG